MKQMGYKNPDPQKPISADEIPDGRLCLQIMFRKGDELFCYNAMGPTAEFLRDGQMRATAVTTLLAASMAMAAAVHGIDMSQDVSRPVALPKIRNFPQ